jgi:hypothetical protein
MLGFWKKLALMAERSVRKAGSGGMAARIRRAKI